MTAYQNIVMAKDTVTGKVSAFTFGNEQVSVETDGKISYYRNDEKNSVTEILDETGKVQATIQYDEYGVILNPEVVKTNGNIFSENLFSYTGHVYDESTGLYYAKARYYDAKIGRFISEDSYRGEQEEVLSRNLYIYGYNNPNRYKDLSGYNVMDFAQGLTDTLDNNIFFGLVKRILKRVLGKGDYHYKNELHYYAGRLTGDVISLLHGMKQIISAVTKIVGSISAGGALTLASAGGLTIGGIAIAVEGVIAGTYKYPMVELLLQLQQVILIMMLSGLRS